MGHIPSLQIIAWATTWKHGSGHPLQKGSRPGNSCRSSRYVREIVNIVSICFTGRPMPEVNFDFPRKSLAVGGSVRCDHIFSIESKDPKYHGRHLTIPVPPAMFASWVTQFFSPIAPLRTRGWKGQGLDRDREVGGCGRQAPSDSGRPGPPDRVLFPGGHQQAGSGVI